VRQQMLRRVMLHKRAAAFAINPRRDGFADHIAINNMQNVARVINRYLDHARIAERAGVILLSAAGRIKVRLRERNADATIRQNRFAGDARGEIELERIVVI